MRNINARAAALMAFVSTAQAAQSAWAQCGGNGFTGETTCVSGYSCQFLNDWYSQCTPSQTTGGNTPATTDSSTSSDTPSSSSTTSSTSTTTSKTGSATTVPGGEAQGNAVWDAAYEKADAAVGKLSQSEKIGIVTGVGWGNGDCVGNTSPAGSIGYPSLCLQDGPLGIRYGSSITAFTPGVQAASTWDRDLIRQRGQYLGEEARGVGVHVLLGPVAGAVGKIAQGGRNWEGFGNDPYLIGQCMKETIEALQGEGVQAAAKHYLLNEQELNRETMSSNPDERTLHEVYLWPFIDAVHADVASVMCSYNKVDGTWACESDYLMNTVLKEELGFKGYVMSDWNAQHTGAGSANAGLDMTMPGTDFNGFNVLWGPQLESAINSGQVSQTRLNDMARRILASWYLVGQDSGYPNVNLNANVQGNHKENVRAVAADGTVLLKNEGSILPLSNPGTIAIIGSGAVAGTHTSNQCQDKACNDGALGMGWGSGSVDYPYFITPADAIQSRAQQEGTQVVISNNDSTGGASIAADADVAIVVVTSDSGEGYLEVETHLGDKNHLDPWHNGNQLVQAVANVNKNVIVVVHSTGPITLETILNTDGVKAIVWGGLPSQESGNALVDILYGDVNPNGKLPYTIAKKASDYGTAVVNGDDNFGEGLYIDYRHMDKSGIEPRYEFGFGLSYTEFTYSTLSVDATVSAGEATGPIIPGGHEDLFEIVASVTATISNDGSLTGAEVAQLYLSYPSSAPDTPPKQLRGFDKIKLEAGASGTVTFDLRRLDLSYWDTSSDNWVVPSGEFGVMVGASSRDIRLEGAITAL